MAVSRLCQRTLSAFEPSRRLWTPVVSKCMPRQGRVTRQQQQQQQQQQQPALPSCFSLLTQNLDAFSSHPIARAKSLLDGILNESKRPDIIFLQEVTSEVHTFILGNPEFRKAFLVTDAEDQTSFEGVPFANMTLLSTKRFAFDPDPQKHEGGTKSESGEKFVLGPISRVKLPSRYGRCALSVDIVPPSTPSIPAAAAYRLVNVHLDSLRHAFPYRAEQLEILAGLPREPGCGGGLVAGDFNAISPDDHALLDKNGLVDAWVTLDGKEGLAGATWGVEVERDDGGQGPGRLDKVEMLGGEAKSMEILRPQLFEVLMPGGDSDHIPCSDHCGPRLDFAI